MICRSVSLTEIAPVVRSIRSPFGGRPFRIWVTAVTTLFLTMSVASGDEVELVTGDVLRGKVVEQTDTHVVLDHSVLGQLEIPRDKITDLDIEAKTEVKWNSSVNVTFNGASGNTEESSLRIGGRSRRRTPRTRLNLDSAYYVSTSDDKLDNNKFTAGIVHDWLIPESRWFFFADGRFDYDQFESWRQRFASHIGPGYDIIDKDGLHLNARAGVGPRKEWGSEDDDWEPEGLVGLGFDWDITRRQRLDAEAAYFPILGDFGNYRTRSVANWTVKIFNDMDLAVAAGVTHEYQSVVDPGKKKNDLTVFTGLQFDF